MTTTQAIAAAKEFGITVARVRQVERKALRRLDKLRPRLDHVLKA